jgi:hypothetical protein
MTEIVEKKGRLKLTVEVEVNDELMDLAKDAMSKMSTKLPEMMRRGGAENKPQQ